MGNSLKCCCVEGSNHDKRTVESPVVKKIFSSEIQLPAAAADEEVDEEEELEDWLLTADDVELTIHQLPQKEEDQLSDFLKENKPLYEVVIKQVQLFRRLSQSQQEQVLALLKPISFQPNDIIVKQGEKGNNFFLISKGTALVYKEPDIFVTYLHAGNYFGELALIYDDSRTASVKAVDEMELMYLSQSDFLKVEQVHLSLMMQQVPFLTRLHPKEQDQVLQKLQPVNYKDGDYIVRQGENGDKFYMITRGIATVVDECHRKQLTKIYEGHVFGEMSLLYNEPRTASVIALGSVKCVYLSKQDFDTCLLNETFKKFIQQASQEKTTRRAMRLKLSETNLERLSSDCSSITMCNTTTETNKEIKVRLESGEKVVNDYIMKEELGKGTFGRVKLCLNEKDKRLYAVKIITKTFVQRMVNTNRNKASHEVAIMKKLHHKNIVRLIEVIDDPSSEKMYLVQEYVAKGNLMTILQSLNVETIRQFMRQLVKGLEYLHHHQIVHRDLKPENILVTEEDVVKIADFGAARILLHEMETLTEPKGTPAFMAPELFDINAKYTGPAVDIWSLGVTLFMLITKALPWSAPNEIILAEKIQQEELVFSNQDIEPHLKNLITRMLAKDPTKRISLSDIKTHEWITKEGSEPLVTKKLVAKLETTNEESEAAIVELPFCIDQKTAQSNLMKAHDLLIMKEKNPQQLQHPVSTNNNNTKRFVSAWRDQRRIALVNEHQEGLSERNKDLLMEQKRLAFSADRATVTELILPLSLSPHHRHSSSCSNIHLPGRMQIKKQSLSPLKEIQVRRSATSFEDKERKGLSRKKDFLMVTSEVFCNEQGDLQKRKVLFEAREDDFSVVAKFRKKKKGKRHLDSHNWSATSFANSSFLSEQSASSTITPLSKTGDTSDYSGCINQQLDNCDYIEVSSSSSSSDCSIYSDVDATDLNVTFDDLVLSPKSSKVFEDDEKVEQQKVQEHFENRKSQIQVTSQQENLSLGIRLSCIAVQGKRTYMEDRNVVEVNYKNQVVCAVYDGHNGATTAETLQENFHHLLLADQENWEKKFHKMDEQILYQQQKQLQIDSKQHSFSGSTAAVVVVNEKNEIVSANVGDSRIVLYDKRTVTELSRDHKASLDEEKRRIERNGGFVHKGRLNGVLALSRSFGDLSHKLTESGDISTLQLSCQPHITVRKQPQPNAFLLIASDGLFDVMTSQQCVTYIQQQLLVNPDLTEILKKLIGKAQNEYYTQDNLTLQLLMFHQH